MKKSSFLLLVPTSLLLIGASAHAATDSKASTPNIQLNCNGSVLNLGLSQAEVIKACGEASDARNFSDSNRLYYKTPEADASIENKTKLKFVNDKLVEISYERENKKFDD
ncbi:MULTISPECIES: DUF2845 domain-containing protein [Cysteiniphilum]|uniref:DUF2845 domain-containing protein n=1 Tax=Cysteiniphilum TaxID=2056696 RepID=UPI0017867CE0|nr:MULTISPECIES: DUF2845 domain-containing protein [Cysteiniphilum]